MEAKHKIYWKNRVGSSDVYGGMDDFSLHVYESKPIDFIRTTARDLIREKNLFGFVYIPSHDDNRASTSAEDGKLTGKNKRF